MTRILSQFWRLMGLCLSGRGGKIGLLLFAVVVALDLGGVYATVLIINWTRAFYDALEKLNASEAIWQVGVFGLIVAVNSTRHLTGQFARKHLEMRWRRTLTEGALDIWMANKAYWHLASGLNADGSTGNVPVRGYFIDNPDQRIAEDCQLFLQALLTETLDVIGRVVGLFTYLALLWSLAAFPLSLAPLGLPIEIPHYMIWAAFIYVALSSGLTHLLGYPLKNIVVEQQRREANFRFALARLRSNVDEVALSGGEAAERRVFDTRFAAIMGNWRTLVNRELILGCFTYPFNHSVLRIPLFVALPGYFAGHVTFGGLMQLSTAFSSVVTSLAWFVFSYRDLANLVAASSRLDGFLEAAKRAGGNRLSIVHQPSPNGGLNIGGLTLATPGGRSLLGVPEISIAPGEVVWLRGASGLGKTTLMKALAGLWGHGNGRLETPDASRLFLPQRPYVPIGDALAAVAYPRSPADFDPAELEAALSAVGLQSRIGTQFGDNNLDNAPHGLSGGELQRLALARLLVHRPEWALLDEPTSALDVAAEQALYAMLRTELPQTSFVVIAHRQPQGLGALRIIDLTPAEPVNPGDPALVPA